MSKYRIPHPSHIPLRLWILAFWSAIVGRRRSPCTDGAIVWRSLTPSPVMLGTSNVPASGPFLVCANHYNGPGVWVGLASGLLSYTLDVAAPGNRVRNVGVASYRNVRIFGRLPFPSTWTEPIFERFYAVYDVIRMPNDSKGALARGAAVRSVVRALRTGAVVIMFPEGGNVENFAMRKLQPGIGGLAMLVSRSQIPVLPAAVYSDGNRFVVSVGPAFSLSTSDTADQVEDRLGHAIAQLLPNASRGVYAP